ncbi:stonustoxin subunit beta-like [Dicentrarchus labrax]|uniref:stonustoxin subunit beta-like n=1 Tax=Dicentrarchus labrax TaxID=13489 RepID=UPI0021F56A2E|nr:stonustoxin subunit beta-like [Dicentrarchus labrax]
MDHGGEQRLKPGLRKYACELTLDTNTADRFLRLSDRNKKVTLVREEQPYPDRPERFDRLQLLCASGLSGRCYWEVEWRGEVHIAVTYRRVERRGGGSDCWFGGNDRSWSLNCSKSCYSVWHNEKKTDVVLPYSSQSMWTVLPALCPSTQSPLRH